MTKNRFLVLALTLGAIYLVLHLLLHDVFIYIIGGAIGIVLNLFSKTASESLFIFLWLALLGISALFFYKIKS